MGKLKIKVNSEIEIEIEPCIDCGCDDIIYHDCGYSAFNVIYMKCKECGRKVEVPSNYTIEKQVQYWNDLNDVDIVCNRLQKQIDELKVKYDNIKSRNNER